MIDPRKPQPGQRPSALSLERDPHYSFALFDDPRDDHIEAETEQSRLDQKLQGKKSDPDS